jgi:hypothetical protein
VPPGDAEANPLPPVEADGVLILNSQRDYGLHEKIAMGEQYVNGQSRWPARLSGSLRMKSTDRESSESFRERLSSQRTPLCSADTFAILSEWFGAAGDQVMNGKPAPDIYLEAASRLAMKPERCVALEDSNNGVLAASRAGMRVLMVLDGVGCLPMQGRRATDDYATNYTIKSASFYGPDC